MTQGSGVTATWAAMAFLFGQTVISIMLFGHLHQDGGKWPIILFTFLTLDLFYAAYMIRLIESGAAPARLVTTSTVLLGVALLVHSNFWLIFGEDERYWSSYTGMLHLFFVSPIFPYGIYLVAVLATKLVAECRK